MLRQKRKIVQPGHWKKMLASLRFFCGPCKARTEMEPRQMTNLLKKILMKMKRACPLKEKKVGLILFLMWFADLHNL